MHALQGSPQVLQDPPTGSGGNPRPNPSDTAGYICIDLAALFLKRSHFGDARLVTVSSVMRRRQTECPVPACLASHDQRAVTPRVISRPPGVVPQGTGAS